MKAHFRMLAAYNAWANARLFAAVAALEDADRRRDCAAAFGSLHGTLNHLLVGDVIRIARIRGITPPNWPPDHIAHDPFGDLRAARAVLDEDIIRLTDEHDDAALAEPVAPAMREQPPGAAGPGARTRAALLADLFNAQTHHRGQCCALLTRLAGAAPALDLAAFLDDADGKDQAA